MFASMHVSTLYASTPPIWWPIPSSFTIRGMGLGATAVVIKARNKTDLLSLGKYMHADRCLALRELLFPCVMECLCL